MFKKTITYTDFNGVERTEDFYFNLTKKELTKIEMGTNRKMSDFLERIVKAKDIPEIMELLDYLVLISYGEKSEDGRSFMKTPQILEKFKYSAACDKFYMSFFDNDEQSADKNLADFVNGIMPAELAEAIDKELAKAEVIG